MIQLNDIHLQLGTKALLDGASLTIFPGQKWGLIGNNGSGKTSLFKLFLGELHEDAGNKHIPKDWQLSHMGQEVGSSARIAVDYIVDGDQELRKLEKQINECDGGEQLASLYAKLESIDGYTAKSRAQQLLHGLGFQAHDGQRKVSEFSGGWRIRLNLARALMCRSDFLLLDEPTNHLDLDATFWLESWLSSYKGTLLIVSHDRDFLDNVIDNIVSIENCKLHAYSGNYTSYELQKAEKLSQQASAFKKQQERVAEIEDFVRRFRAKATKAKQAQSRLKELERMERIAPAHIDSPFTFHFPQPEKVPNILINLSEAAIGYSPGQAIADNIEFTVMASSRIGLLGSNGAGKSTLIKTLANELPLLAGTRSEGMHLNIGYFAQHQLEALDLHASCATHLQRLKAKATEQEIRTFLGSFGFSGDRVFETITHFSGGEKARLALAIVAWQRPNLLILDEPTNHLDLEVRHALTMALQAFDGAIVVVSHDRHLLKNTVDDYVLVDHHKVEPFDGTLLDYQKWLNDKQKAPVTGSDETPSDKPDKREKRQAAAATREKLKPLSNAIKKLENEVDKLQTALDLVEKKLSDSSLYDGPSTTLEALLKEQGALRESLHASEEEWMDKSEQLEILKAELEE